MRCTNCNKFTSMDPAEPEAMELEYTDGSIVGQVRIVRQCAECSSDMKEAFFDLDEPVEFCTPDDTHEVTVEDNLDSTEESGGRYAKAFFGAQGTFKLTCTCGKTAEVKWSDKIAASHMDECL